MDRLPELILFLGVVVMVFAGSRLGRLGDAFGAFVRNLFRSSARATPPAATEQPDGPAPDGGEQGDGGRASA